MGHWAVYVRRSYARVDDATVSDETQEAMARAVIPAGASVEVIRDTQGHHSGATTERDGYRDLVARLAAGSLDGIAVYDLSRLHRNATNMLALRTELERRQVPLLVATMPGASFDGAMGRFMFGQIALSAQLQRDLDSERMVNLTRSIFEAGGHRGLDPFGYRSIPGVKPRTLEVVPEEAAVVRRIWEELPTRSTQEIADRLNRDGVSHRVDRPWTRDAVKDIVRRGRFYLGYVRRGRDVGAEERPGRHEAILDEETWRDGVSGTRVRVRGERRRSIRHRIYLLAGIVHHDCGRRMTGSTTLSRGQEWRYYRCRDCRRSTIDADSLEATVLGRVRTGVLPADAIDQAREALRARLDVPADHGKLRRRLQQRRDRLAQLYAWGDIDGASYQTQRREVERDLLMLPDEDKLVLFDRHRQVMVSMAANVDAATPEQLKELCGLLVESAVASSATDVDIEWTGPAMPFFDALVIAPPDGTEGAVVKAVSWYAETA